jgi:hypothetical protein
MTAPLCFFRHAAATKPLAPDGECPLVPYLPPILLSVNLWKGGKRGSFSYN